MERAYSVLTTKAVGDGDERIIRGIATTPTPDRSGDIVEPLGVRFKNPMPLLHQHDHKCPIGTVVFEAPTAKGIVFEARLPKLEEPSPLKDRVDQAWAEVKAGLVRGVSIGFISARGDREMIPGAGTRYKKIEIFELSLVTVPDQPEAVIHMIKSIDRSLRAAEATRDSHAGDIKSAFDTAPAVAAGGSALSLKLSKVGPTMAILEQISALEAKRAANASRMEDIVSKSIGRGETMAPDETEEFDGLAGEIKQIDGDLVRLKSLEKMKISSAKAVAGASSADAVSRDPSPTVHAQVRVEQKLEPGVAFARIARVKALARLDGESVREVAKNLYGEASIVYDHFAKAAVPAANSADPAWAGNLIAGGSAFADFVEYLRPRTILGKFGVGAIPALRRIPFDTPVLIQNTGGVGYWVGEGKAKPLTSWTTSRTTMTPLKVAAIAAVTDEMLRRSSIDADIWIRDELANAVIARTDMTFIDPSQAAVNGVSPASITNGVVPVVSSGTSADAIRADMLALSAKFRLANNSTSGAIWIMPEGVAEALMSMTNPLGQPEFPGLTAEGGFFLGKPVITSQYVPSSYDPDGAGATPAGAIVVLAKPQDIFFGDGGNVQVDFSREASLEMADNPGSSSVAPTGSNMVSMFQTNTVAFRAERTLNWMKRRPESVAVLAGVHWGA